MCSSDEGKISRRSSRKVKPLEDIEPTNFVKTTYTYGAPPTKQGPRDLLVDLYTPRNVVGPWPLVTWLHSGGFRSGTRRNRKHGIVADAFARRGYASAFLDYRLARPPAILTRPARQLVPKLIEDSEKHGEEMQESFRRQRPIAVVEDVCSFYQWIEGRQTEFRLNGEHILAGSSSGGISVLNSLMLHEAIDQQLPKIRSAFVFSGGFAYPSYWKDGDTRILALHNPNDAHVPFSSINRIESLARENFKLLVSAQHAHGSFSLTPEQHSSDAVDYLIAFDRRVPPQPTSPKWHVISRQGRRIKRTDQAFCAH